MKTQLTLDAGVNGGMPAPPNCFICTKETEAIPYEVRFASRRELNTRIEIVSPGVSGKYPLGLVRHSRCAPGTDRWAKHTNDAEWLRRFGFEVNP